MIPPAVIASLLTLSAPEPPAPPEPAPSEDAAPSGGLTPEGLRPGSDPEAHRPSERAPSGDAPPFGGPAPEGLRPEFGPEPLAAIHPRWRSFEPEHRLTPCPFEGQVDYDPEIVRCGQVLVPEDRRDPASRLIRILFMRVSPLEEGEGRVLVRLAGGPGGPAISGARAELYSGPGGHPLRRAGEIVFFDQRGVGASEPAFCRGVPRSYQLGVPMREGYALRREARAACIAEAMAQGTAVHAYTNWDNALDVRDLRRALGHDRWTLFGISYGTELAQHVMRVDPDGIRAVILDSVVPMAPAEAPRARLRVFGVEGALRGVARACADEPACADEVGDLYARFEAVFAALDEAPIVLEGLSKAQFGEGRVHLDGQLAASFVFLLLYQRAMFGELTLLLDALERRDEEALRALADGQGFPQDLLWGGGLNAVITCREDRRNGPALVEAGRRALPQLSRYIDPEEAGRSCPELLAGIGSQRGLAPLESDLPVLVANGALDPITPPAFARAILPGLSRATYVEVPWTGHGALLTHLDGCGGRIVRAFVADPEAPLDTSCADAIPPPEFATSFRRTAGPLRLAAAVREGRYPLWALPGLLLLLVAVVGFPVAALVRWREGRPEARGRLARRMAALSALVTLAGVVTAVVLTLGWAKAHPAGLAVGLPSAVAVAGGLALLGLVLGLGAALSAFRNSSCPFGTRWAAVLVAAGSASTFALLVLAGAGPL